MKNFFRTIPGKTILFISCFISISLTALFVLLLIFFVSEGLYESSPAEQKYNYHKELVESFGACTADYLTDEDEVNVRYSLEERLRQINRYMPYYSDESFHYAYFDENGELLFSRENTLPSPVDSDSWEYRYYLVFSKDLSDGASGSYYPIYDSMTSPIGEIIWDYRNDEYVDITQNPSSYTLLTLAASFDEEGSKSGINGLYLLLVDMAWSLRHIMLPAVIIFAFLSIALYIMLMCVSARRPLSENGEDAIFPGPLDHIPFDVMSVVTFSFYGLAAVINVQVYNEYYLSFLIALAVTCAVGLTLILALSMGAAARIKQGKLFRSMLIVRLVVLCFKLVKRIFSLFYKLIKRIRSFIRASIFVPSTSFYMILFIFLQFLSFVLFISEDIFVAAGILLMFLVTAFVVICAIYHSVSIKKITIAVKALAGGAQGQVIDPGTMKGIYREQAEALNNISEGIGIAVNERVKSERMKTELITNVSHDIKTPLTSIINYADLIGKEECDNEKIHEYSEVLKRQSERLKRLIEDLVEASKASSGNLEVNLSPCSAELFITQTVGEYEEKFASRGLNIVSKLQSDSHPMILADGRRMLRVFDNLMNNIFKYAKEDTRVYLSMSTARSNDGNMVCFTFKNTSEAELDIGADELVERFVRGDRSRHTDGNGLGLSIAKSLTELQGGSFLISIDGDLFKAELLFPEISST